MAKKHVRNNADYEELLKRDHPAFYKDLRAGKYRTLGEALTAAGLKKPRTRLHELKNAWSKASISEQREFLKWARAGITGTTPVSPSVSIPLPIAVNHRLMATAAARIEEIMAKRYLQPGDVMAELGYSKNNTSVSTAINNGWKLKPDVMIALEKWLAANVSV